jgi:uncharacterized membrane protein
MLRQRSLPKLPFWSIPMIYALVAVVLGLIFPRLEYRYLAGYNHSMTVSAATAVFSAAASCMLAFMAIIFALAFVIVPFGSTYSSGLVLWLSRDSIIWHVLGIFTTTFLFALVALGWMDRNGSGQVPFFLTWTVIILLIASVMVLACLVQRLMIHRVTGMLNFVSRKGRQVIDTVYPSLTAEPTRQRLKKSPNAHMPTPPVTQTVNHTGPPMVIAAYNVSVLVSLARQAGGVIIMSYAVGNTLFEGDTLLSLSGGQFALPDAALSRAVELQMERTFDQDPKYALRLLVDIAIKALSPVINDPATAVQALDHIEDLLRHIASRRLEVGQAWDRDGVLRLIFPTPKWEDFLMLAFDELRFYGETSLQVMRRLRTALVDLARTVPPDKQEPVRRYIAQLDSTVVFANLLTRISL